MNSLSKKIKNLIKKNNFLYYVSKSFLKLLKIFDLKNRSLFIPKKLSNNYQNIFILDTRVTSIIFDSVLFLIRGSNFFYKDKWTIIIYEDDFYRYSSTDITDEIYLNSLINIFLQSLLILPNPPISIKFVNNSYELLKIIKKSNKIFPEGYNFLDSKGSYLLREFSEKDFQDLKINQPTLKANKYYSKIFENYLGYRNIKKYITITIRTKNWGKPERNTNLEDMKLYLDFIKKNNLENNEVLILPDTQEDVPKEIINFIEKNDLKYYLFHHGSFSIPMRFLAYSNSSFNFGSDNGPPSILFSFINNNSFLIVKDPRQGDDYIKFANKFNKNIFLDRKFIFHKRYV
jgi:hypothetical protein